MCDERRKEPGKLQGPIVAGPWRAGTKSEQLLSQLFRDTRDFGKDGD